MEPLWLASITFVWTSPLELLMGSIIIDSQTGKRMRALHSIIAYDRFQSITLQEVQKKQISTFQFH